MMMSMRTTIAAQMILPCAALADGTAAVETLVRPGFAALADEGAAFATVASATCDPHDATLRAAFDAWIAVSHYRFGPSEEDDRAFGLAYWPDARGATPQTLATMITDEDPAVDDIASYAEVSIAARGFYALEFLFYDPRFTDAPSGYSCALTRAIATDIASTTAALSEEWQDYMPSEPDTALYNALLTGLEFTAETRIGRPLGTFDRPRPARAEAWRSERSLHNVELSLTLNAMRDLALILASGSPAASGRIVSAFNRAIETASDLDDPVFAGVADPQSRLRVEVLQQQVHSALGVSREEVGARLGVVQGFTALDGD